jgi:hypothetical protein
LSSLRILVVGGFTRLDPLYRDAPAGVEVDAIYHDCPSLEARAAAADAIVLIATNVSHPAAAKARIAARRRGTPLETARGPSVARVRASITAAFRAVEDRRRGATSRWRRVEGSANGPR